MSAAPQTSPISTRPAAPIQWLSKANLRNKATPINTAMMPMRLNHCDPRRLSTERSSRVRAALRGAAGIGAAGALPETGEKDSAAGAQRVAVMGVVGCVTPSDRITALGGLAAGGDTDASDSPR